MKKLLLFFESLNHKMQLSLESSFFGETKYGYFLKNQNLLFGKIYPGLNLPEV